MTTLSLEVLQNAVQKNAAAFRCRTTLQPAGGEGDKVFPPTYAGAVYATEKRRLPGREEPVECVLLDSVQSQANRMEEALQQAIDEERLQMPVIEVDFTGGDLLTEVGKVTSLDAPHRIADAILRDSLLEGTSFRQSELGRQIDAVSLANATPIYQLCPTALVFGMWDSTGPKGGLGAKFQRAMVSEIVGIDAQYGVKTSSRIDPLQIEKNAGPLYRTSGGGWTLDPTDALDETKNGEATGRKVLYQKVKGKDVYYDPEKDVDKLPDSGRPSTANHGNVTPDIVLYKESKDLRDPMSAPDVDAAWSLRMSDADVVNRQKMRVSNQTIRAGQVAPGGVTVASAEQMVVLSLPALRRLRFPLDGKRPDQQVNDAGRTVLAALGLCAAALAAERGFDLRSRCLLWPTEGLQWEMLGKPGADPEPFALDADTAIQLLKEAVSAAEAVGLNWRKEPLVLRPSPQLVALVRRSQELTAAQDTEEGGD